MKNKLKKINIIKILEYLFYVLVAIFALLAISSSFSVGGFKLLVVKSGSMEPAIKTGSIVIDKNYNNYNIGDIITFKNLEKPKETSTHRIAEKQCAGGICLFKTKGDANNGVDLGQVAQDKIVGKVILSIPYFGYLVSFCRSLPGIILLIVIPAVIIVYEEAKKIHKEVKEIRSKKKKISQSPKKEKK